MKFRDRVFEAVANYEDRERERITSEDERIYEGWANNFIWEAEVYDSRGFRAKYVIKLFRERYDTAAAVFAKIGLDVAPGHAVVSVGCGPGASLAAAFEALQPNDNEAPDATLLGVEPVEGWRAIFDAFDRICRRRFNRHRFTFRVGKLSPENNELRDILVRERAAVVILSHVMLDFVKVKNYQAVIDNLFKIETVKQVVIMERTGFQGGQTNLGLQRPAGCDIDIDTYEVQGRKTHVVVITRLPASNPAINNGGRDTDIGSLIDQLGSVNIG